jgi:hypothetical protein
MEDVLTSMVAGRCYLEILRAKGIEVSVVKREETPYWARARWAKGGQALKGSVSVIADHGTSQPNTGLGFTPSIMSSPDVQKAWLVVRQGRPEQALELDGNWPVQKRLRPGDVLVRTQAAALNPM